MGVTSDRNDPDLKKIDSNGMQEKYLVLSEADRVVFVRPVRLSYLHETCGSITYMGKSLAETYARDPEFYSGTYCATCQAHFPVGEQGEFLWAGTQEKVGT